MSLEKFRADLESTNKKILSLIETRRKIVGDIQRVKSNLGSDKYDPKRELELFISLRGFLEKLSLKELLSFSLLMEDQAGIGYPEWSQLVHLVPQKERLPEKSQIEQYSSKINPLLLLLFYPDKIKVDYLKIEFKTLPKLVEERG